MTFWDRFHNRRFTFDRFARGMRVLDVGFGEGEQMQALLDRGCEVTGVDYSFALVDQAKARGFNATQSPAENLPFPAAQFDGLICKVVVPYTDEARAIAEWARVLKPGGVALVSYHGAGYFLRYIVAGDDWKHRVYGVRALINSWVYRWSGYRLPGFVGDTIYQSEARLRRYYQKNSLRLEEHSVGPTFFKFPVFIYHQLRRVDAAQ